MKKVNILVMLPLSMKQDLSKQYNAFAQDFISEISHSNNISRNEFYKKIPRDLTSLKVLDLACGDGSDIFEYKKRGAICSGCDSSEELIKVARQKIGDSIDLQVQDMRSTSYNDQSFDMVFSKYAIGTVDVISDVYDEVSRIIKPGGLFVFLTTHPMRLFLENKNETKDYFIQESVPLECFNRKFIITEPSHTFNEFFSRQFFKNFELLDFTEHYDPQSASFNGRDIYPDFFIVVAQKK